MPTPISRKVVRALHQAHADHIENIYRRAQQLPGNPDEIEILNIGATRVFLSNKNRLENRAIFTGNETLEELQEVAALFDRKGTDGFFEINPANFYRTDPFSWKSEMLPTLLDLGFFPDDMRCVWYLDQMPDIDLFPNPSNIRKFTSATAAEYAAHQLIVEPVAPEKHAQETERLIHRFTDDWTNFIGYEDDQPVSVSHLYTNGSSFFLAWGYTQEEYRRRGHHKAHVVARLQHAFEVGCEYVFSVTDFSIPSSISLQKTGFSLAYNYLMLTRRAAKPN